MTTSMLNVVNENGDVIGVETRDRIHREGLLHKEVHIWAFTPGGEVIFQLRAKDKDTYPGLLDVTCGGHVEIGDDWLESAIKEMSEETGLRVGADDLVVVREEHTDFHDQLTGRRNNALRRVYLLFHPVDLSDLRVEAGKSQGFEPWKLEQLHSLSPAQAARFIPVLTTKDYLKLFETMHRQLLGHVK